MARQYTVLSEVPPRATKARPEPAAAPPEPVRGWRVRAAAGGPVFVGSEQDASRYADEHPEQRPILERLVGPVWGAPPRDVPTVADLAHEGMARQTEDGKAWKISALGQDVIYDAMRGTDD